MHSVKEKVSNAASAAKEHVDIYKAKVEEKAAKASARTKEEKDIAHERRIAKEAEAKMHLHQAKADHAAEKLDAKLYRHHGAVSGDHHNYAGTTTPLGVTAPYPSPATAPVAGDHHNYAGTAPYPTPPTAYPSRGGYLPGQNV